MNSKIGKFCNCTKKDECPSPGDNYECCSEMVPGGSPARFGLWMENNTCDPTKGLPKDAHLQKEKYMPKNPQAKMAGPVEGYNRANPRQAPQEDYYSPESYSQQDYPQQGYTYSQRTSSIRSCPKKTQQMYPRKAYVEQSYRDRSYVDQPYSRRGYQYEDDEDEYEYEDEDEDPCGDLRTGFNILLWVLVIGVVVSGVYYLKSKKPKEK